MLRTTLGIVAVGLGGVAYLMYLGGVLRGRIRPAALSWLLWAVVTAMAYTAQSVKLGGAGSWVTGASSIACLLIGLAALRFDHRFGAWQAVYVVGSLVALYVWKIEGSIIGAAVALTATDVIGYIPTLAKGWANPYEDMIASFVLNSLKYAVALFALEAYSWETLLYPGTLVAMNGVVAGMLRWRRQSATRLAPPGAGAGAGPR